MIDFVIEPLQYAFMVRGLIAAVMVGIVCAVVGTYVVLRGMAFFGDALAHAILPGIAIGYLIGDGARGPLFGDVLGVLTSDLWLIAIFGGLVVLAILAFYKEFMVLSFDPILAATLRLPVRLLEILLLILIAVTIVVSLQTVASISGVIGLYFSYYLSIASGSAIVLTCTAIFGLVWGAQTLRQRLNRKVA